MGVLLLLLSILLVWLYTLLPLMLFIIVRNIPRFFRYFRKKDTVSSISLASLFTAGDRRLALLFLCIVFFASTGIYAGQRRQWMRADNANLQAKEYYVVGQVVYTYRRAISSFLAHPDMYKILVPLNAFQKLIYTMGVTQLPADDAEEAVWAEQWFVYIYSRNLKVKQGSYSDYGELGKGMFRGANGKILTKEEAKKGEVPLLPSDNEYFDLVWHCLETMATREFADKEMREHHYLRNYPGMAHYYALKASRGYAKLFLGSRRFYVQMESMTKRNELLVDWLEELPDKWRQSEKISSFIREHPKVEAMREMALILTLVNIFDARIWAKEFDCADPYFRRLYAIRGQLVGENNTTSVLLLMKEKRTALQFYKVAINSPMARFSNFVAKELCGTALPGKENMREFEQRAISPEDARRRDIRALFSPELKLLGMTDVLEEKYWTKTPHGYEYR